MCWFCCGLITKIQPIAQRHGEDINITGNGQNCSADSGDVFLHNLSSASCLQLVAVGSIAGGAHAEFLFERLGEHQLIPITHTD